MQIKIFTIPVIGGEHEQEEMNHFLRAHRVADVQSAVVQSSGMSWWTFRISYLRQGTVPPALGKDGRAPKTDYKELLEEAAFGRFCEYREIRKNIAAQEALPPFAIFTDAELAEIAKLETPTHSQLKTIKGVGAKKIEKYGNYFVKETADETSGASDAVDS